MLDEADPPDGVGSEDFGSGEGEDHGFTARLQPTLEIPRLGHEVSPL